MIIITIIIVIITVITITIIITSTIIITNITVINTILKAEKRSPQRGRSPAKNLQSQGLRFVLLLQQIKDDGKFPKKNVPLAVFNVLKLVENLVFRANVMLVLQS